LFLTESLSTKFSKISLFVSRGQASHILYRVVFFESTATRVLLQSFQLTRRFRQQLFFSFHNRVCDGPECIGGLGLWQDANTQNSETLFETSI
jgi:hypothetical protein